MSSTFQELTIDDLVKDRIIMAEGGPYQMRTDPEPNTITLQSGSEEMIKVGPDGFWVRGKKVEQDDKEAEVVYNAFKHWLTWAQLNKDYK